MREFKSQHFEHDVYERVWFVTYFYLKTVFAFRVHLSKAKSNFSNAHPFSIACHKKNIEKNVFKRPSTLKNRKAFDFIELAVGRGTIHHSTSFFISEDKSIILPKKFS